MDFKEVDSDFIQEDRFQQKFMSLSEATRKIIGHQFGDAHDNSMKGMIKACSYGGGPCKNMS